MVIEDEAYTVKRIYRMYADGDSMGKIADLLNEDGIPAKKGGKWNRQSIHNILRNPLYLGCIEWDGIIRDGGHSPILDKESYEVVNGPIEY